MKLFAIVLLLSPFATQAVELTPYVLHTINHKFTEFGGPYDKDSSSLHFGVDIGENYYFESGYKSAEAGWTHNKGNFTFKGKLTTEDNFKKHGLKSEIKYTFQK